MEGKNKICKFILVALIFLLPFFFLLFNNKKCFLSFYDPISYDSSAKSSEHLREKYEKNKTSYEIKDNIENSATTMTKRGMLVNWGYDFDDDFLSYIVTQDSENSIVINSNYFWSGSRVKNLANSLFSGIYDSKTYNLCFNRSVSRIQFCLFNTEPQKCSGFKNFEEPFYANFGQGKDPIEDMDFRNEAFKLEPKTPKRCFSVVEGKNYKISFSRQFNDEWSTYFNNKEIKKHMGENNLRYDENVYPVIERVSEVCLELDPINLIAKYILIIIFLFGSLIIGIDIYSWMRKNK